jgi:hypothetical protein
MFINTKFLDNIKQRRLSPHFLNFATRCELQPSPLPEKERSRSCWRCPSWFRSWAGRGGERLLTWKVSWDRIWTWKPAIAGGQIHVFCTWKHKSMRAALSSTVSSYGVAKKWYSYCTYYKGTGNWRVLFASCNISINIFENVNKKVNLFQYE